jgi:hypothetical protein
MESEMRTNTKTKTVRTPKPELSRAAKAWATRRKEGGKDAGHSSAMKAWETRRAALKTSTAVKAVETAKAETRKRRQAKVVETATPVVEIKARRGRKSRKTAEASTVPAAEAPFAVEMPEETPPVVESPTPETTKRRRSRAASTAEQMAAMYPGVNLTPTA